MAELGRGFADAVAEELDFRAEARNIAAIAAAAPAGATIMIPTAHTDISGRRLLVLDRFDGTSLRDAGPWLGELGADRNALARELLGCLLNRSSCRAPSTPTRTRATSWYCPPGS